jgi:hypothetical protein
MGGMLTVGLSVGGMAIASAASAATPFCNFNGNGLCLSDHGNTSDNAVIFTENPSPGPNQDVTLTQNMGACGGTGVVQRTPGCPFNQGSGNNTAFAGDEIVTINMPGNGKCIIGATTGQHEGEPVLNGCTAAGTDFVVVPGANGRALINVWVTNNFSLPQPNLPQYLDSQGQAQPGFPAVLQSTFISSPNHWAHP